MSRTDLDALTLDQLENVADLHRQILHTHTLNDDERVELIAEQSTILTALVYKRLGL